MEDDLSKIQDAVLAGQQRIVSYPGTGQYQGASQSNSTGIASCGLAALNCARIAFQLQEECVKDSSSSPPTDVFLRDLLSRQTVEVRVNIMPSTLSLIRTSSRLLAIF